MSDFYFVQFLVGLMVVVLALVGDVVPTVAVAGLMVVLVVEVVVLSVVVVVLLAVVRDAEVGMSVLARAVVLVPVLRNLTKSCWNRKTMRVMMTQNSICACLLLRECAQHPARHVIPGVVSEVPEVEVDSMMTMAPMTYQVHRMVHRSASTERSSLRQGLVDHPNRHIAVRARQP